jgi:hypothetical protein
VADNVTADPGTGGAVFATDDIGGVHYPITKITIGALESQTLLTGGNGATDAGTVRVTVSSDSTGVLTVDGVAAENAPVSGNPVLVAGRYDVVPRTLGDGDVGAIAVGVGGAIWARQVAATVPLGDGISNTANMATDEAGDFIATAPFNYAYNGATWDRMLGDSTNGLLVNLGVNNDVTVAAHDVTNAGTFAVQATQSGTWNIGTVTTVTTCSTVTNLAQLGGAAVSMNTGVRDVGTQRVTIATNDVVPVSQSGTWNITNVSGTISLPTGAATSANQATHTTALQLIDNMIVAHDAAITGATGLAAIALNARSTSATAVQDGDAVRALATLLGKIVTYPYAIPANTWQYAAASGGITNTTGVTARAAGGAGIRNYINSVAVINGHATVSTDVQIRDGAAGTVLWRGFAQAAGGGASVKFDPPLRGTANTLVEVACGTTGSATYFNLQGFAAAE